MPISRARLGWSAAALVIVLLAVIVGVRLAVRGGADDAPPPTGGTRVVGYFTQWGAQGRGYPVKKVETSGSAARLTHLVYAFGKVADGRCAVGDPAADHDRVVPAADSVDGVADSSADALRGNFGQLRKLKTRHPGLKVLWSFGGWNGSAGFTAAARDPAAFAASCRDLLSDGRWSGLFDGIDIDWEYPNSCGRACDTSGRDALTRMTAALRSAFGPGALVTAAVAADGNDGGRLDAADYAGAATHLDWVMAMTYDYFGTGNGRGPTAPHSALSGYSGIPRAGSSTEAGIDKLTAMGIPAGKLLLGIGFYGRGWTGVTQPEPGGSATGPAPGSHEPGLEDYRVLRERCPPTGTVGGTAYAWCGGQWWGYDTPDTITTKMAYARSRGLGGAFVWELSGDTDDGELLSAVAGGLT
jgi:chitinase